MNSERGISILAVLMILLLSSGFVALLSNALLQRTKTAQAYRASRKLHEQWESYRAHEIRARTSTRAFLPLSPQEKSFATIPIPSSFRGRHFLRLPLFRVASQEMPLLQWDALPRGTCRAWRTTSAPPIDHSSFFEQTTCTDFPITSNALRVHANLALDDLTISFPTLIAATGQLRITHLHLKAGATVQLVAGGSLEVGTFDGEYPPPSSPLVLHSRRGEIRLPHTRSTQLPNIPLRLESTRPTKFQDGTWHIAGSPRELSPPWRTLLFLGELEQKSWIDSQKFQ